jgi:hypothetical protein
VEVKEAQHLGERPAIVGFDGEVPGGEVVERAHEGLLRARQVRLDRLEVDGPFRRPPHLVPTAVQEGLLAGPDGFDPDHREHPGSCREDVAQDPVDAVAAGLRKDEALVVRDPLQVPEEGAVVHLEQAGQEAGLRHR